MSASDREADDPTVPVLLTVEEVARVFLLLGAAVNAMLSLSASPVELAQVERDMNTIVEDPLARLAHAGFVEALRAKRAGEPPVRPRLVPVAAAPRRDGGVH